MSSPDPLRPYKKSTEQKQSFAYIFVPRKSEVQYGISLCAAVLSIFINGVRLQEFVNFRSDCLTLDQVSEESLYIRDSIIPVYSSQS